MPKVPVWNNKPLSPIYKSLDGAATYKQKNLILTLCERHKIKPIDVSKMSKQQASQIIDNILHPR